MTNEMTLVQQIECALEKQVATLINEFKAAAYNFFAEKDLHCYLYHSLCRNKIFSQQIGNKTIILHTEYPTFFRYRRDKGAGIVLDPKGDRGHYDLVILNPEFIERNDPETISGKNFELCRNRTSVGYDLIAAVEFKFIINQITQLGEIEIDIKKLQLKEAVDDKEREPVKNKYVLIFNRCGEMRKDFYAKLKGIAQKYVEIRSAYVESYTKNSKKIYRGKYYGYWKHECPLPTINELE